MNKCRFGAFKEVIVLGLRRVYFHCTRYVKHTSLWHGKSIVSGPFQVKTPKSISSLWFIKYNWWLIVSLFIMICSLLKYIPYRKCNLESKYVSHSISMNVWPLTFNIWTLDNAPIANLVNLILIIKMCHPLNMIPIFSHLWIW